jgi:hypothetical protein
MTTRSAFGLIVLLQLSACSSSWTASLRLRSADGAPHKRLQVTMRSSLGDEFHGVLEGACLDVRIRQSPKLPNRITITIADADGNLLGEARTNDLAKEGFDIPLGEGKGVVTAAPGQKCP